MKDEKNHNNKKNMNKKKNNISSSLFLLLHIHPHPNSHLTPYTFHDHHPTQPSHLEPSPYDFLSHKPPTLTLARPMSTFTNYLLLTFPLPPFAAFLLSNHHSAIQVLPGMTNQCSPFRLFPSFRSIGTPQRAAPSPSSHHGPSCLVLSPHFPARQSNFPSADTHIRLVLMACPLPVSCLLFLYVPFWV